MVAEFEAAVEQMPLLLERLLNEKAIPVGEAARFPNSPGVYLISDPSGYLYAGRCKNLRRRMGNHGGKSPDSSTFAFRLACSAIGRQATYRKGQGRKALMGNEVFRAAFHGNVDKIRKMESQFVVINDDLLQHLFEVYVHVALKTPHNSFATH